MKIGKCNLHYSHTYGYLSGIYAVTPQILASEKPLCIVRRQQQLKHVHSNDVISAISSSVFKFLLPSSLGISLGIHHDVVLVISACPHSPHITFTAVSTQPGLSITVAVNLTLLHSASHPSIR